MQVTSLLSTATSCFC